MNTLRANIVDIVNRRIFGAELSFQGRHITSIRPTGCDEGSFLIPPFIDAHIHLESSLLSPPAFAQAAVAHGTLGVCADPHEIANVAGLAGLKLFADYTEKLPFYFYFGIPPCVPATNREDSPFSISSDDVAALTNDARFHFLAEVMDYKAVLRGDPDLLRKISLATNRRLPIDGHAPLLSGDPLQRYVQAGISTDHEASSLHEAHEKLDAGLKILIREGSDARNFDDLYPLIDSHPNDVMFCADDLLPNQLIHHHIDDLVRRAVANGCNLFDVLRCASLNPALHYFFSVGLLRTGDFADFLRVDSLVDFNILDVVYHGTFLRQNAQPTYSFFRPQDEARHLDLPQLNLRPLTPNAFALRVPSRDARLRVIVPKPYSLLTEQTFLPPTIRDGFAVSDTDRDLLKLVVVNRHRPYQLPAVAFIQGSGLLAGAIAQSISHDSHHIIALGVDDIDITNAVNEVIRLHGGIVVALPGGRLRSVPLPAAGLFDHRPILDVARDFEGLRHLLLSLRPNTAPPFPPLAFLALTVIPHLKLSHKGLFLDDISDFVDPFVQPDSPLLSTIPETTPSDYPASPIV
jgi:adenine deaminase